MEIVIVLILTNLFILLVMRSLNENNAKYLLAGYNTMSKEKRENFKIKEYLISVSYTHLRAHETPEHRGWRGGG